MRVILDQNEIFQAITDYVRSKWKLEQATTVEISLTAGRSPKGYSADVEITYPVEDAGNVTTRVVEDVAVEETDTAAGVQQQAEPVTEETAAAAGVASTVQIFD